MAYIPDPTDASQPTGTVFASTAAAEFRAIKAYLGSIVAAGLPPLAGNEGASLIVNGSGQAAWSYAPNMLNFYAFR